jgi:hypothetical protein
LVTGSRTSIEHPLRRTLVQLVTLLGQLKTQNHNATEVLCSFVPPCLCGLKKSGCCKECQYVEKKTYIYIPPLGIGCFSHPFNNRLLLKVLTCVSFNRLNVYLLAI